MEMIKKLKRRDRKIHGIDRLTKSRIDKFDGGDNIEPWLRNLELYTGLHENVMDELEEKVKMEKGI